MKTHGYRTENGAMPEASGNHGRKQIWDHEGHMESAGKDQTAWS